ncbi:serine hydrolase [Flammeovirga yaeyamensis]|uniref:Serine hydrolase n=1 Tax=Flammeovirga yaeyamensis TaxID=367791 RepID=A0AAX1N5D3_9BACT|nr:serine hydrolase domain-containing protein [Flammeovirga yaeyamensis]MBB3700448.1 CubicO group peptidase (beta-lactamase class C family) [Flammeovirga yaeyamensis]NMF36928.1 serine hydrolase [Flammeovirga yaeyamensis]QWG02526.1 serine hydrolase [Flammeovirga yaeyamensis]
MKKILLSSLLAGSIMSQVNAQGTNVHEIDGDYRTPIKEFSNGFTQDQVQKFRENYNLPHLLKGGDDAVWWGLRTSELFNTALLEPNHKMELVKNINPAVGEIKAQTKHFGEISLNDFMVHPHSYAQGFLVVHKGEIVFENYQGMTENDHHVWMSAAKIIPGLAVDLLISDGKIDENQTIGHYVHDFKHTAYGQVKVKDVMDMTTGLNSEENDETRSDPNSITTRMFLAEFGLPYNGKNEKVRDVLKDAESTHPAGEKLEYGSPHTQMLVLLVEAVSNQPFSEFVDERIYSKMGAESTLNIHLSPNGVAIGHGIVSSRLRDMAKIGMLYTPSWNKTATEQVVSPEIISRIQHGTRSREFYRNGFDGSVFVDRIGDDDVISNARQWDGVWEDGDFWKSGIQSQGIYVSPKKDLVIVFFSTNVPDDSIHRYARQIANSGLFDEEQ